MIQGSQGGYILGSPSELEGNYSGCYKWLNPDAPIVDAPDWLLGLISKVTFGNNGTNSKYSERFQKTEEQMGDGDGRNNYIRDYITSRLRMLGIKNKDEAYHLALGEMKRSFDPPLPQAEFDATFNSQVRFFESGRAGADFKQADSRAKLCGNPAHDNFDPDNLPNLEELEIPERVFLVDGLIEKGQLGQIVGDWGCGKTYVALALANAVANGARWCGLKAQPAQVLVLDRENTPETTQRRMAKMNVKGNGKLKVFPIRSYIEGQPTSFDIEMSSDIVTRYAEKHPGCLLIVDSLRGWLPHGADENKAVDIRAFMNLLRKLTAKGASVLVLHHNNKIGQPSGSTDIGASADYGFSIEPTKDPISGLLLAITLKHLKQREEMNNGLTFKFDGQKFERESPRLIKVNSKHIKMIEILQGRPGLNPIEVHSSSQGSRQGYHREIAKEFLEDNIDNGNIRVEETGQSFRHHWEPPARQSRFDEEGENPV